MIKTSSLLLFVLLLVGCSGNITNDGDYPTPLVPKLPVNMELELSDAFKTYVYEDNRSDSNVQIKLGEAQTKLFETLNDAMFTNDAEAPSLKITPKVNDFQFAIPRETRSEIYEVWIKYRVAVQEPDGQLIADWILTGYGKTPTGTLKSKSDAINSASLIALRDIGTQLSIGFKRQPDIALWLENNNAEASAL